MEGGGEEVVRGKRRNGWGEYEEQQPATVVSEGVRRMLNVCMETGHVYGSWSQEVLCTVPKVKGSTYIGDTRPIGLLVILRNSLMGIIYRRVRVVWEEHGVIASTQLGSQRGMGTEEARMLQTYVFE